MDLWGEWAMNTINKCISHLLPNVTPQFSGLEQQACVIPAVSEDQETGPGYSGASGTRLLRRPQSSHQAGPRAPPKAPLGGLHASPLTSPCQALVLCHMGVRPGLPHVVMVSNSRRRKGQPVPYAAFSCWKQPTRRGGMWKRLNTGGGMAGAVLEAAATVRRPECTLCSDESGKQAHKTGERT